MCNSAPYHIFQRKHVLARKEWCLMEKCAADLLVHDGGELGQHVFMMSFHLLLILQLIFFYETLVHLQGLTTRVCELPAGPHTNHDHSHYSIEELL